MTRLDKENLPVNIHKCEFAQTEIVSLGYKVSPNGITPTEKKTNTIAQIEQPHTSKQLRSIMGSLNLMIKFILNFSNITALLRPPFSAKKQHQGLKIEIVGRTRRCF